MLKFSKKFAFILLDALSTKAKITLSKEFIFLPLYDFFLLKTFKPFVLFNGFNLIADKYINITLNPNWIAIDIYSAYCEISIVSYHITKLAYSSQLDY